MLQRLSRKLGDAVAGRGRAYRLGGDEFCVVAPLVTDEDGDAVVSGCVEALSEDGEGFQVRVSWGCVRMPAEAASSAAALTLADQRMYHHKGSGRSSARQQTRDLVLRVLAERRPDLHEHVSEVAALAQATGEQLGLDEIELEGSCGRRSSTTSARSRSRTPSSTSPAPSTTRSGASCAATR